MLTKGTPVYWSIVFPFEQRGIAKSIKKSCLGTEEEIVNDTFNEIIENNFTKIYGLLEDEITIKK